MWCIEDYDEIKELSYIQYCDANNLYRWRMSQKLPVNNFKWIKNTSHFNEDFIKDYSEESNERYFLEVDVQYLQKWHELENELPFLPERIKIEKFERLVANLHYKTEYVIHIRKALNNELVLKKLNKIIEFNQNVSLKPYIDKTIYWPKKKMILKRIFLCWRKTIWKFEKHRDIKLVTTEKRRNYLVSELNFLTTKFFT